MTDDIKLPPLPEKVVISTHLPTGVRIYGYTADQMQAYAREAVRMNASQAENVDQVQALREALKELITWVPSADTYRRLGFDPEAAIIVMRTASRLLRQESIERAHGLGDSAGEGE